MIDALLALTFAVWCLTYAARLPFLVREGIRPDELEDRRSAERILESISAPADNFKNQLELPVQAVEFGRMPAPTA